MSEEYEANAVSLFSENHPIFDSSRIYSAPQILHTLLCAIVATCHQAVDVLVAAQSTVYTYCAYSQTMSENRISYLLFIH